MKIRIFIEVKRRQAPTHLDAERSLWYNRHDMELGQCNFVCVRLFAIVIVFKLIYVLSVWNVVLFSKMENPAERECIK